MKSSSRTSNAQSNSKRRRSFWTFWRIVPRTLRRARKGFIEFWSFVLFSFVELFRLIGEFLYNRTLPFTKRFFSRVPNPPIVTVQDIRAGRIRLEIKSSYSSLFNVEEFEVQWTEAGVEDWKSTGPPNDITLRTVARLKSHSPYEFRVRAYNNKGVSGWSKEVSASTRIDPVDGGGYGPGDPPVYTWTQNHTEVTATFELPAGTTKKDLLLVLKGESLLVELRNAPLAMQSADIVSGLVPGSPRPPKRNVLLEGQLYAKVQSFENGSFWELIREDGKLLLILTFEKYSKSLAPKFDYWRSLVIGHDEIDTHKIVYEQPQEPGVPGGMQMLQPGMMTDSQRQQFGLA